jgi:hypothetical protein
MTRVYWTRPIWADLFVVRLSVFVRLGACSVIRSEHYTMGVAERFGVST